MKPERDPLLPTRWTLLSRIKDWADSESWKDFFDTYWKLIYATATKAGLSAAEADEVVQETIITVAKRIGAFKTDPSHGSFKGWLLQITYSRISDQFRKRPPAGCFAARSDRTEGSTTAEQVADPGLHLEQIWNEEWEKNLIEAALERVKKSVSARQYQIYYLNVIKKMAVEQVCHTLGVNAAQVYLAKHRVGSLLKKEIRALETKLM